MIKGITVTLYERTQSGTDAFGAPVYTETPVQVGNVLVCPAEAEEIRSALQLEGRRLSYQLCLPKGDAHAWEGCRVDFFGQSFRAYDAENQFIDANVPGPWNRRVKVERFE